MKLTDEQKDLVRLILRSKDDGEGWRRVSKMLWPHVKGKLPADLVEEREAEIGAFTGVRLTARGQAVADYL